MIDFKKMDDKDFIFVNQPISENDEKEFSAFLKLKRTKAKKTISLRNPKSLQT